MMRTVGVFVLSVVAAGFSWAEPSIALAHEASSIERYAAEELQRYLYAATGELFRIEGNGQAPRGDGFVIGTPGSLPALDEAWPFGLDEPLHDGYILHTTKHGVTVVAGKTPKAVRNGVFGLLDSLGVGFYLSDDAISDRARELKPSRLPRFHESRSPVFPVRGTMLEDRYLTGPAAWTDADFQTYVDHLVKLRLNALCFRFTDWGLLEGGDSARRFDPSLEPEHFLAGTGEFLTEDLARSVSSRSASLQLETIRRALAYAKARGLGVSVAIPAEGNPAKAEELRAFRDRLLRVLGLFPEAESVWLWAPELAAVQLPAEPLPRTDALAPYLARWHEALVPLEPAGRRAEVARLVLWETQARKIVAAVRPEVELVVGGDGRYGFGEFIPAVNALLPKETAVACLTDVSRGVEQPWPFGGIAAQRPLRPVLGLEFDGDLWMPQPNLKRLEAAMKGAADSGAAAVFGLHWRTRWANEAGGYFARAAWDPELTAEQYTSRRARDLFGDELGPELETYAQQLQELDYRWLDGLGQSEPAPFAWAESSEALEAQLVRIGADLRDRLNRDKALPSLLPEITEPLEWGRDVLATPLQLGRDLIADPIKAGKNIVGLPLSLGRGLTGAVLPLPKEAPAPSQEPLRDLYAQIRFVLAYNRAAEVLGTGGAFDVAVERGDTAAALKALDDSQLAETMHLLAQRVRTKGELGILTELNTRAWASLRERLGADVGSLAEREALPRQYEEAPFLLVLPDSVVVVDAGGGATEVVVKARRLGEREFAERRLEREGKSGTYRLSWPEEIAGAATFEYGVVAVVEGRKAMTWPTGFPAVTQTEHMRAAIEERSVPQEIPSVDLPVALESMPVVGSAGPRPAPSGVKLVSRGGWNVLAWDSDTSVPLDYVIVKYGQGQQEVGRVRVPADHGPRMTFAERAREGLATAYAVGACTPGGDPGAFSSPVGVIASGGELKPRLHLSLRDEEKLLESMAQVGAEGLALGGAGWSDLPPQRDWSPERPVTVAFRIRLDNDFGMPVLICKGSWRQPGYYLQLFGGRVRFYLAGVGTLDAGELNVGQERHVTATYDGHELCLYIDGRLAGRKTADGSRPVPLDPLLLARYGVREAPPFVAGVMDDIRVYDESLAPQEVEALASGE